VCLCEFVHLTQECRSACSRCMHGNRPSGVVLPFKFHQPALMSSDGFKNVHPQRGKFMGQVRHQGRKFTTNTYATCEEAARAVDRCVRVRVGGFCVHVGLCGEHSGATGVLAALRVVGGATAGLYAWMHACTLTCVHARTHPRLHGGERTHGRSPTHACTLCGRVGSRHAMERMQGERAMPSRTHPCHAWLHACSSATHFPCSALLAAAAALAARNAHGCALSR